VVAVALVRTNLAGLGTFTIPAELLQLLGLSQVVFIGGKAIEKSAYNDLDDKLTEVRQHALAFQKLTAQQQAGVVAPQPKTDVVPQPKPEGAAEAPKPPADGALPGAPQPQRQQQSVSGTPEVERAAFKAAVAQAADIFWVVYGDQIGTRPHELDEFAKLEPGSA
jgi:hypothetical protein